MILLLASSYYRNDPQTALLTKRIRELGKNVVVMNPFDIASMRNFELSYAQGGDIELTFKGQNLNPSTLFISRLPRTDCIVDIPKKCQFPTLFRQKMGNLVDEIITSLSHARLFPGSMEQIKLSEAKVNLMKVANDFGLAVPKNSKLSLKTSGRVYKKSLGYPFSISFDQTSREETGVTLFNGSTSSFSLPWLYQSKIDQLRQIRCVVIGKRVRAYVADWSQHLGRDMREVQETQKITWEHTTLPADVNHKIINLCDHFGLEFACPEFLVNKEGEYIFIDLNPCGDWYGFIDEDENDHIAKLIAKKL